MASVTELQTTSPPLRAGRWDLDSDHSSVTFSIPFLGVSRVRGRFNRFSATLEIGSRPEESSLTAAVDVASVDTGIAARDQHLRSPELLDVASRSTITFVSDRIIGGRARWRVDGRLSFGRVTRPMTFDVGFGGVADSFDGTRHAGFTATGTLSRTELGIDLPGGIPTFMLGDVVDVELDVQFVEPS